MLKALFVSLVAVFGLLAAGCVEPPPPDPEPEFCPVGYFSADGEEPCTPAPAGTFVDVEGATEPTPCPVGTFQDEEGQAECKVAPQGTFVDFEGAAEATLCPLGTFQDLEGQVSCNAAAPGTFVDFEGAAAATACPLGRFQPDSGAVECLVAPIGTYVDVTGAIAATDCPPGTTTEFAGATSVDDCVEPATFVVAYSNLDGVAGYDASGSDVLIARLLDTNGDGVVSVGDTVETRQYPLDFAATTFGSFGVQSHEVYLVSQVQSGRVDVHASDSLFHWQASEFAEVYREFYGVSIVDFYGTNNSGDELRADPDNLYTSTHPDTAIDISKSSASDDEAFIDVDIQV